MIIGLASTRVASSIDEGLDKIKQSLSEAAARGAEIVCFPEAYLPGLRGQDFQVLPWTGKDQDRVVQIVADWARSYRITIIFPIERLTDEGRQIAAMVFDAQGTIQGCQTKNQLDPSEDRFYVP